MKKFHFQLDPLIKLREHREKMAQQAVAKARRDVVAAEERMAELKEEQNRQEAALAREVEGGISAQRFLLYTGYIGDTEFQHIAETQRRNALLKEERARRQELADKSVEKKILENLKELKKDAYYKEMREEEQKSTDDMTVLRKARDINS